MARYRDSVCRICRREGLKLFLKADRCYTDKCSIDRRAYPPGQHGQGRKKVTEYGTQLREKQKVRRMYGLLEKQFRGYFKAAERKKGVTGENLLVLLETRLDNIVYRLGFASSRNEARQMVNHGHFLVNGKKVDVTSYLLKPGNVIEVREKSRKQEKINSSLDAVVRRGVPEWLELERDNFKGTVKALPTRDDITMPIQENLIVELYSK
ncbi:MAG: 30S ribosomal protein S4 [Proteobacteria bacterium]|nr:30S ribosomal protein S4 [Pseudomonadota bacterium]